MKNEPEYPDSEDILIKHLAEEHGVNDFNRAREMFSLSQKLQTWAIQDRSFVVAVLQFHRLTGTENPGYAT